MGTNVKIADNRTTTALTFGQLPMGQWFLDDADNLCCKVDVDEAFIPNCGMAQFCEWDEVTAVEEIRIEVVK